MPKKSTNVGEPDKSVVGQQSFMSNLKGKCLNNSLPVLSNVLELTITFILLQVGNSKTQMPDGDALMIKDTTKGGWVMPKGYFCK